jgi:hypothetical protein
MSRLTQYGLYVFLLLAATLLSACSQKSESAEDTTSPADSLAVDATVDSLVITLAGADSVSVLELLRAEHTVEVHESAMGAYVKAIDSIDNAGGYFWLYSVNDSAGKVAADKHLTSDSDIVVWHYRKIGE